MALKAEHIQTGVTVITGFALAIPAVAIGKAAGTIIGIGCGLSAAYTGAHYLVDNYGESIINKTKEKLNAIRSFNLRNAFRSTGADTPAEVVPTPAAKKPVVPSPRTRRSKRA